MAGSYRGADDGGFLVAPLDGLLGMTGVECLRHLDEEAFMTLKKAMARRDVLRMGALGATAAWAATRAKLGLAAGKVPIGVQLYSVRKDCEKDLPGTLKALKGFGYEAVEFRPIRPERRRHAEAPRRQRPEVLRHPHRPRYAGDALAKTIEYNKTIGNKFLIVPGSTRSAKRPRTGRRSPRSSTRSRTWSPPRGCASATTTTTSSSRRSRETPWALFFGGTKKAVVQQVDTGNCIDGGGDPVALVKAYPGRTATIHIKEFSKTKSGRVRRRSTCRGRALGDCETTGGTEWYDRRVRAREPSGDLPRPAASRTCGNGEMTPGVPGGGIPPWEARP